LFPGGDFQQYFLCGTLFVTMLFFKVYHNMKNFFPVLILLLGFSIANSQLLSVEVQEYHLANGLTVLLYPDHHTPSVACRLFYKVGSVNEGPGTTGSTHMLEHMLFKGTKKTGVRDWPNDSACLGQIDLAYAYYDSLRKNSSDSLVIKAAYEEFKKLCEAEKKFIVSEELWNLYLQNGGTELNAFTTDILTAYFVTLPKNKIELFFYLESDRMQNMVLREFYSERDVVAEERRLRYENRPEGRYWETINAIFFEAHPYRNPTIGYMSDIQNYSRKLLQKHFDTYYKPNNAVLVMAGDFEKAEVLSLVNKYFAGISSPSLRPPSVLTEEPQQNGEKRFVSYKKANPRIDLFYHTPGLGDSDLYALDIAEGVLSGRNGRLYKRLVKELELCVSAGAGNEVQKYTSYFHVYAELKEDADPQKVESILKEELKKIQGDTISAYELTRVKNNIVASSVNNLREMDELANQLGFWEVMGGWKYINLFPQEVEKVQKDAIKQVAKKYLIESNRTVGMLLQEKEAK
jgi:predicted Zn-dependent peptidase